MARAPEGVKAAHEPCPTTSFIWLHPTAEALPNSPLHQSHTAGRDKPAPMQSNRILATLRVMFGWASDPDRGYMDTNIAAGIRKKAGEKSKNRALDYDPDMDEIVDRGEIKQFWNGLDFDGNQAPEGVYVYRIDVKTKGGETHTFNGTVTLLR